MELVVVREGRVNLHVGDVVEVPDDAEAWPFEFAPKDSDAGKAALASKAGEDDEAAKAEAAKQEEIARAEAELAQLKADEEAQSRLDNDGAPAKDGDK